MSAAEAATRSGDVDPALSGDKSWRMGRLLDLLAEHGRLSVTQATRELGVSEATVRRDFTALANQQLATRTHGGVVASSVAYDLPVRYRSSDEAKKRIATAAAALVSTEAVIAFNGGTTTSETARSVVARSDLATHDTEPALTVVTNALNIAVELVLRPWIRTVSLGGVARPGSYEVVGPMAHQILEGLWIDHLFLGIDGFAVEGGVSCRHEGEAGINAGMVDRAQEITVVSTSDKLGRRAFARICDTSDVHRLVTDTEADPAIVEALRARGVDVVLA